jgi:hypothetical protein
VPVTIDYETPTDDGSGRRRVLFAAVAAVAALLLALVVLRPGLGEDNPPAGPATSPTTGPPLAKGGLPLGPAKANAPGTRQVYGVPRGFPHTEAGAVEAATAANEAIYKILSSPDSVIAEIGQGLSADGRGDFDPRDTAAWRKQQGINAAGQVVDPQTGQVIPQLTFYNSCYAEYGAYRVTSSKPDEVTVEMWFPCLVGPGSDDDLSRVRVYWIMPRSTFVWVRGDWHDKVTDLLDDPPEPTSPSLVNVSFAEREKLLRGEDWVLYADATEKPLELGVAS